MTRRAHAAPRRARRRNRGTVSEAARRRVAYGITVSAAAIAVTQCAGLSTVAAEAPAHASRGAVWMPAAPAGAVERAPITTPPAANTTIPQLPTWPLGFDAAGIKAGTPTRPATSPADQDTLLAAGWGILSGAQPGQPGRTIILIRADLTTARPPMPAVFSGRLYRVTRRTTAQDPTLGRAYTDGSELVVTDGTVALILTPDPAASPR